jgi:hypothetical protein
MQIGAKTKDTAITAAELTSKGMTTVVEFLKKSEKYLSEKVEEWKKTNPELVAEGQASLNALRAKIAEYETKVRLTLKEAL